MKITSNTFLIRIETCFSAVLKFLIFNVIISACCVLYQFVLQGDYSSPLSVTLFPYIKNGELLILALCMNSTLMGEVMFFADGMIRSLRLTLVGIAVIAVAICAMYFSKSDDFPTPESFVSMSLWLFVSSIALSIISILAIEFAREGV